jgi:hypothetical protein
MNDELYDLHIEIDGVDEPLKLHGGFDGYPDPYPALAKVGLFRGKCKGRIVVGDAHLVIAFESEPIRRDT